MISDIFEDLISGLITKSAPQTRDQSVAVIDNVDSVVTKLGQFADQLNADKAGTRESYKLGHRHNVPATATVFVYADRPDIVVDVEVLSAEFMNTKAFDDRYYIDGLVEVLAGTKCIGVNINAFQNCTTLKKVELPKVTGILHRAFEGCTSLEEVIIPLCTELSDAVFYGCSSLKSVNCPSLGVRIGTAFSQCENLETVDFSALESVPSKVGVLIGSSTYFSNSDVIVKDGLLDAWKASFTEDAARIFSKTQYSTVRNKDLEAYQKKSDMSVYAKTTDLADYAKTSEYTKTTVLESTYAKKTDLDSYDKKTDILEGSRINVGTKTFFTGEYSQVANVVQITFTPEALGMADGEKLVSLTIHTRPSGLASVSACCKIGNSSQVLQGMSNVVNINHTDTDYTFTFTSPITLRAGETYTAGFYASQEYDADGAHIGLKLKTMDQNSDIFLEANHTWRPQLKVTYMANSTLASIRKLITETSGSDLSSKLSAIGSLTQIGDDDYGVDDVKDRVDVLIGALKSLL